LSVVRKDLGQNGSKPNSAVSERFAEINRQLTDTIGAVKAISTELRPGVLDKFGLAAAIDWQCRAFSRRTGIRCEFKIPRAKLKLSPESSTAIFRILQEALTNIARHAQATEVKIFLRIGKHDATLTIADNGRGITQEEISAPESLGLLGMRERAESIGGSFFVENIPQKGTMVSVRTKAA
jgi:signal transduction histidine kinase